MFSVDPRIVLTPFPSNIFNLKIN